MNAQPIELHRYRTGRTRRANRIKILRNLFIGAFAFMAFVAVLGLLVPFVLDAAERESQWRADRLCQQGYFCDPKAGP